MSLSTTNKLGLRIHGYADETHHNVGRFRGVGMVSLRESDVDAYKRRLEALLSESNVREFKWSDLRSARERFAALKLIEVVFEAAALAHLRIDILIWDTHDRRHDVVNRDDTANLQRMYYHLFRNVLGLRWPNKAVWKIYPDENSALNWSELGNYLELRSVENFIDHEPMVPQSFRLELRQLFEIEDIAECQSHSEPFVQVADLFVGMGVYSYEKYKEFCVWKRERAAQADLFNPECEILRLGRLEEERFQILDAFNEGCKRRTLGVSLATRKGLHTFKPENPINFWMYTPQREDDLAPLRRKSKLK